MYYSTFVFLTLGATGSPISETTNSQSLDQLPKELAAQSALLDQCDLRPELELETLLLSLSTANEEELHPISLESQNGTSLLYSESDFATNRDTIHQDSANPEDPDDDGPPSGGSEDIGYVPPISVYSDESGGLVAVGTILMGGIFLFGEYFHTTEGRTCTDATHRRLKRIQDTECGKSMKCGGDLNDCDQIRKNHEQFTKCIVAREKVIEKCYGGEGDTGHWQAIDNYKEGRTNCETRFTELGCEGVPLSQSD